MRKTILYIAMSLDGYIADPYGGVAWLGGDGSDNENPGSYPAFIETIDTIILGYKTYHQVVTELSPGKWMYSGKTSYVLTHREMESSDEIIFTDENLPELIKRIRKNDGKDIWICGGAAIANQFLALDEIDQFCVSIIPTILGDGVRLFDKHQKDHPLKLVSTRSYNGIVDLVYERRG